MTMAWDGGQGRSASRARESRELNGAGIAAGRSPESRREDKAVVLDGRGMCTWLCRSARQWSW